MAILPSIPGLKVEVLVDGAVTREYPDDKTEEANTTTHYIEAVSGATFKINCYFTSEFSKNDMGKGVKMDIWLDGERVCNRIFRARLGFDGKGHCCKGAEHCSSGKEYLERFRFSEFKIENDGSLMSNELKAKMTSLGLITVTFLRLKKIKKCRRGTETVQNRRLKETTVPEKAVKPYGLSHYGSFDAPKEAPEGNYFSTTLLDDKRKPYAVFNFKYRSIATLKVLGMVPRTPTPVPLEQRPANELNLQEALELVNRYRDREAAQVQKIKNEATPAIKREYQDADEVVFVSAKRQKRSGCLPTANDEVVELD